VKTEKSMLANAEKSARLALAPIPHAKKSRNRRKAHLAWEQADRDSGGLRARNLEALAQKFPKLTPMELRVCVLVKEGAPSWRIGELLCITEKTVEHHRSNAHATIGCPPGIHLFDALK
jgi:DNA-binding CsgD family transcriptional regulator